MTCVLQPNRACEKALSVVGGRARRYDGAVERGKENNPSAGVSEGRNAPADADTPGILQRVASGDAAAVRECLDRFGGLVWSLARRLTPTASEAEDAVQEIFIDVWKSSGRYDPSIASETAFVAMIARRRLIDRQRRAGRRPNEEQVSEGAAADVASPEQRPEIADDVGRVSQAFDQLSDEQQRVLRLSIHQGLSHEKISRATGLPLGTVKTHARRGLIKLREILAASPKAQGEAS